MAKTNIPSQVGKVIELAQKHPSRATFIGAVSAGLIIRHRRKKKNDNIGNYASTITAGQQSAPSGSAAGMNNAPSAWIQMNGAGYSNPAYQGAKYGFTRGYPMAGNYPTFTRPSAYSPTSRMTDNRYGNYDIAQDQQLSSMI